MPESQEIDTDNLRETIVEEIEQEGSAFLRKIALTTSLFAALAAIAALEAGSTVNEALVLKTEATRLQAEASDQWAFYQSKGIKSAVSRAGQEAWLAAGKAAPAAVAFEETRNLREQRAIEIRARQLERARDRRSTEADRLLQRHHRFAQAVALLQVAIALGAVAALTKRSLVWWGSLGLGIAGSTLFAIGLLAG